MIGKVAIKVDNVSKSFKLPHEKQTSIKGALINFMRGGKGSYERQQVLKNISFEIGEGEFFGIVGRNGSGKSTLLKILAGIYTPSSGSVTVNGKLTPFIELGVGFNYELTGRENVFLNGALLGFSRKEMELMYNDIVEFAELERFMDQKLKNYSSGMQVRLAFSIAIRAESPILLLDEVLAVGDEAFQKKCMDVFEKYKAAKKTIVLVTHDMGMVERFCSRAVLISNGDVITIGDPEKVSLEYTALNTGVTIGEIIRRSEAHKDVIAKIKNKSPIVKYGEELELLIDWSKVPKVKNLGVAVFSNAGEYVHGVNSILEKFNVTEANKAVYKLKATLGNGEYFFKIGLFGETDRDIVAFIDSGPVFVVKDKDLSWQGLTSLEHKWEIKSV